MEFIKTDFYGDPNIGLYGFATESYCLMGMESDNAKDIEKILEVEIKVSSIAGTRLVGIFIAGNKNGLLVPKILEDYELKQLKKMFDNVVIIDSKQTALGNLILCNDKGCLIPKSLEKYKEKISECLKVPVEIGTIHGSELLGSAGRASNTGCLIHREASDEEIKKIEDVIKGKS